MNLNKEVEHLQTSHYVKKLIRCQPGVYRVDLALKQERVQIATSEHVDECVAHCQPPPHHRVHICRVPDTTLAVVILPSKWQVFDVTKVDNVIRHAIFVLETLEFTSG